ncbi:MAG: glycosyltransferase family 4 protein [Clostridiales bacterium]|nr:glycosyltransferase family 4 protein [Candidatus Crickella merdequi]
MTEIVNSFDRAGHTQGVVAGIYREDTVAFPEGVSFYPVYFDEDFPIYGMSDSMPYPSSLYREMDNKASERFEDMFRAAVSEAVNNLNPDIIICHHLFLLTAIVREMYPDRYVCGQCHGSDLRQFRNCPALAERIARGIRTLDRIYALHKSQADEIVNLYGVEPERITISGSGYNAELFNTDGRKAETPEEPLVLVYAGKLSKAKGVPELFEAVRKLSSESRHSFRVIIAGGCQDSDVQEQLNNLIAESEEQSGSRLVSVEYLGLIKQVQLADVFRKAHVFVLPSYYEGLGLVLIEAMASGLVPVTNRLPGIKEWIDSSINNSNAVYVNMPEMELIDKPYDSELPAYIDRLADGIAEAFDTCIKGFDQPDTSRISWDNMADYFTHK